MLFNGMPPRYIEEAIMPTCDVIALTRFDCAYCDQLLAKYSTLVDYAIQFELLP